MAPFIKYTSKIAGQTGNIIFINAGHISKASYSERDRLLQIYYNLPESGRSHSKADLEGDEAEEAVKILRSL